MLGNAWFSVLAAMVEKSVGQGLPGRFCRVSSAPGVLRMDTAFPRAGGECVSGSRTRRGPEPVGPRACPVWSIHAFRPETSRADDAGGGGGGHMVLDGIGSTVSLAATHRTTRLASGE